jgi:gliding motility-associated-like protein
MPGIVRYSALILLLVAGVGNRAIAQLDIVAMEYFIDTDPGVGGGTAVPVTIGTKIDESFVIPASALPVGFHTVYIRVKDVSDVWSISESRTFYISASDLTKQANITAVEYFIDSDPGYGAGTSLPLTAATSVDLNPIIPTSSLSAGFHVLYVRSLDSDGFWGDLESRSFYISTSDLTTQADITAMEYYIDTDPGYGSGISVPVTAAKTIDISPTITASALPAGHHVLYIRAQDQDGFWSEIESRSFYIDAFAPGKISGIEYFFNSDPGYGSGTAITIAPAKDSIDSVINISTVALTAGSHILGLRIVSENSTIGMTDYYAFTICDGATADFVSDTVCIGSPTSFTDLSLNVLSGDIYSWDFDNDGFEDSNTQGDQVFTYPVAGVYTAKLTIDRSGCISTDSIQVSVEVIPVADAGPDQANCTDSAVMAANAPGTNETGNWIILNGAGVIVDPLDPLTTINNITTASIELEWSLTNTLAGCSDRDTVFIVPNLPIAAVQADATVEIGQTVNLAVQTGATINTGDVLTTTIVMLPAMGATTILADGTIDYVPNDDAVGTDTLTFRLCNQCGNCADNLAVIELTNQPPTISPTPISADSEPILAIDLTAIVADPNGNIDLNSLRVVSQPISGAFASIDASGILTINYTGIIFSGQDQLSIEVCDLSGACTTQVIFIDVISTGEAPPITVFNAVSPNGDGYHEFLEIENIQFYPDNRVFILSRWGVKVAQFEFYDNQNNVFRGSTLPSGVYYYHVVPGPDFKEITGHFVLKVD